MSNVRILDRGSQQLLVKLTQDEEIARGRALAKTLAEISSEDSRQQMLRAEMKSTLAKLEAERDRLRIIVQNGEELREVATVDVADYDAGRFRRERADTGEVIVDRTLSDSERQMEHPDLTIVPPPAKDEDPDFDAIEQTEVATDAGIIDPTAPDPGKPEPAGVIETMQDDETSDE